MAIEANGTPYYGWTSGATIDPGEPDFSPTIPARRTVWYRYRATSTGHAVVVLGHVGASFSDKLHFIDVYAAGTIRPSQRVAEALPEYTRVGGVRRYFVRLSFPTVAGSTYHIRVGGLPVNNDAYGNAFRLDLRQFGAGGGIAAIPVRDVEQPVFPFVGFRNTFLSSIRSFYFTPQHFLLVNTTDRVYALDATTEIPGTTVQTSDFELSPRSDTVPGVALATLKQTGDIHPPSAGLWRHTVVFSATDETSTVTLPFQYEIQRFRTDRGAVAISLDRSTLVSRLGRTAVVRAVVRNVGQAPLTNCALSDFYYGYQGLPARVDWRLSRTGPRNIRFSVPVRGKRTIYIAVAPHFVGTLNPVNAAVLCEESGFSSPGQSNRLVITGTR